MKIRHFLLAVFVLFVTGCNLPEHKQAVLSTPVPPKATATRFTLPTLIPSATLPPVTPTPALPPLANGLTWVKVPIEAIQVSDDDGSRSTPITVEEVSQWVSKANEIWAGAGIQFEFNPQSDLAKVNSTLLNNMTGKEDKTWLEEINKGDKVAAQYPGMLTVFFHHTSDVDPAGKGAFSWYDYNFVVMPAFNTSVCGYQNIGMLAHEIGHFLGLPHTFAEIYNSVADAEADLKKYKGEPEIFDGDGFSDTPPDPFINKNEYQCSKVESVKLNGLDFPIPRSNIMSYYEVRSGLSPQQIERARWTLSLRSQNGMAMPSNANLKSAIEIEDLKIKKVTLTHTSLQDMALWGSQQWSGGKQLFCGANPGGTLTLELPVNSPGNYSLALYGTFAPDFGTIQISLDGQQIGKPVDFYAPVVIPSGKLDLGSLALKTGEHELSFVVTGKNPVSSNYLYGLDALVLVPLP